MSDNSVSKPLSIRQNIIWNFSSTIIYSLTQWGMIIFFAKIGTKEMVGVFGFGLSISTPIIMLTNVSLRSIIATDANESVDFLTYLTHRIVTSLLFIFFVSIICLFSSWPIIMKLCIFIISLSKFSESISDICYGFFQKHDRMDYLSKSMIIRGISSFLIASLCLYLFSNILISILFISICWFLVLFLYDLPKAHFLIQTVSYEGKSKFIEGIISIIRHKQNMLKNVFIVAFPLGVATAITSLATNIPSYLIEHYLSVADLGIFTALIYINIASSRAVLSFAQAFNAPLSRHFLTQITSFRKLIIKGVVFSFFLGILITLMSYLWGALGLTILYGKEYSVHNWTFVFLMIAATFTFAFHFVNAGITAARRFKEQIPVRITSAATMFIAGIVLIPNYGLLGASLSVCLTSVIRLFLASYVLIITIRNKQTI